MDLSDGTAEVEEAVASGGNLRRVGHGLEVKMASKCSFKCRFFKALVKDKIQRHFSVANSWGSWGGSLLDHDYGLFVSWPLEFFFHPF